MENKLVLSGGTNAAEFPADLWLVIFLSFKENKYLRSPSDAYCHFFSASSQDPLLPLLYLIYLFLSCAEIGLELFTVSRHEALNQLADIWMKRTFFFFSVSQEIRNRIQIRPHPFHRIWVKVANILKKDIIKGQAKNHRRWNRILTSFFPPQTQWMNASHKIPLCAGSQWLRS